MIRFKREDGLNYPDLQEKKLGEIALLSSSKRVYANEYVDKGIPFYRGKEISELQSNKEISDILYISKDKYEELKNKYGAPVKGDILITAVGTLGNTWVVDNENPFYFKDGNLIWLREIKEDSYYLNYIFNSPKGKKRIIDSAIGSNQKALTIVKLSELEFLFPCKDEQKKISDFLSSVDDIIQVQEEEILTLEEQKKGMMQRIFNREVRFKADDGSEYSEWEEKELAHIVNLSTGKSYSNDLNNNGKYIVMDMGAVSKDGKIIALKHTDLDRDVLNKGDLIMPKDDIGGGFIICKTAFIISDNKYVLGDHVYRLQFPSENSLFMHYLINSERVNLSLKKKVTGSAQLGIKVSNLLKEKLCIPCIDEQKKIADCLSAYDEAIQIKKDKLEVWKEIKKGLLQQMFV